MKKTTMIIIAVIAVLVLWCISAYNGMVGAQEDATQAWSDVQNTYQRRADLIPNLVETVKGKHTQRSGRGTRQSYEYDHRPQQLHTRTTC